MDCGRGAGVVANVWRRIGLRQKSIGLRKKSTAPKAINARLLHAFVDAAGTDQITERHTDRFEESDFVGGFA